MNMRKRRTRTLLVWALHGATVVVVVGALLSCWVTFGYDYRKDSAPKGNVNGRTVTFQVTFNAARIDALYGVQPNADPARVRSALIWMPRARGVGFWGYVRTSLVEPPRYISHGQRGVYHFRQFNGPMSYVGVVLVIASASVIVMGRRRRARLVGRCAGCGYGLEGLRSGTCPECGEGIGDA
jgi:hypothetical protein